MTFSKILIEWYLRNKRDLPWRNTKNPYHIWLSEIILQQTRVAQGLPYYLKFINAYPKVEDLAGAPLDSVLKLWQGLGYYSRARNLHETANYIANECKGIFPSSYNELLKLKGIGDYTASAIASTCFEEPVPAVDGNVFRVLARYFNIDTPTNSSAGLNEFRELSRELLANHNPWYYNQAIMEFGATHCTPKLPLCESCPFNQSCLAIKLGKVGDLPVKIKKGKIKKRYFNYLVFRTHDNHTVMEKRKGKGIWEGLYQFPLIETSELLPVKEFCELGEFLISKGEEVENVTLYNDTPLIHKLTHQHIYTRFWIIDKPTLKRNSVQISKIKEYPVPVLIANFINEYPL
ncbi:A/G-specific adenine glycosylase [soil metagenome]